MDQPAGRREQPAWRQPPSPRSPDDSSAKLHVFNSLTLSKTPFAAIEPNQVGWYACGPTVYDSAHLGHARAYVTFDIIRRILQDYLGYNITYVMNITDIDDKIILRARRNHLFKQYADDPANTPERIAAAFQSAVDAARVSLQRKIDALQRSVADAESQRRKDEFSAKIDEEELKLAKLQEQSAAFAAASGRDAMLSAGKEFISAWLDDRLGATVTDHTIFRQHAAYYESEFLADMAELNVRQPDVLTRVSEYVPQIESFVAELIRKGFAYETNGSVYFDVEAFAMAPGCHYAKLCPWSVGNETLQDEGEGALKGADRKRNRNDFALWKKSKPGEPAWESRWGAGRPGWHIECSVMASDILGSQFDIHSGGEDLKFPHHDNEIAQSEAFFGCPQWVNYFLHAGHLSIDGLKMSKSLKNFITIREALNEYTPRQIRLLFLLQGWDKPMNFNNQSLDEAVAKEKRLNEFFKSADVHIRRGFAGNQVWRPADRDLHEQLLSTQSNVHRSLLDNFDYPSAMGAIFDLLGDVNKYLTVNPHPMPLLLKKIAAYFTQMLKVFGVIADNDLGFSTESLRGSHGAIFPILDALTTFRSEVRQSARGDQPMKLILDACDRLRDEVLPELGVRLEDKAGESVWKLDDPETMRRERQEAEAQARLRQLKKLETKLSLKQTELQRLRKNLADPSALFRTAPASYAEFDADGVPTVNLDGSAVTDKNRAKLLKALAKFMEAHDKARADPGKEQSLQSECDLLAEQIAKLST